MGSVAYKSEIIKQMPLTIQNSRLRKEKKLLMTEEEKIKSAVAHTDTIRLTLDTIERLKMVAGSHPKTWDQVLNEILDVYYDAEEKKNE
jgi:hypothetical protein